MALHLLVAGFALLMVLRHGPGVLALLSREASPEERRRALPRLGALAAAVLLLVASLVLLARLPSPVP